MSKLDLKASLKVFAITFLGVFFFFFPFTFRNIYFRNTDFQDHFTDFRILTTSRLEKQILLQSSNVSGMQKLSVGTPGILTPPGILPPPELFASVLKCALSPSLEDCLSGGNSQCHPRHQACGPEVFTFSLSSFRVLQTPAKQETSNCTVCFLSKVKSHNNQPSIQCALLPFQTCDCPPLPQNSKRKL